MKDKQGKHDHKLTKLLKFGLFATLMVAPLFAVLFKCMYVTFNKNAYQSYSGSTTFEINYKYETNEVDTLNDLVENNIYHFKRELTDYPSTFASFNTYEIYNLHLKHATQNITYQEDYKTNQFTLVFNNSSSYALGIFSDGGNYSLSIYQSNRFDTYIEFDFVYRGNMTQAYIQYVSSSTYNEILSYTYDNTGTLDNAFYYSVDEMQNNSLFNWTTSTAIYTPINAMTSGLGINTDAVAILLTYWLYLTLIYIVIDIVIELFTWMTHTLLGKPLG